MLPVSAIRGLPWAGCPILAASSSQLAAIRSNAAAAGVLVANMPSLAQATRVHDEYLEQVSTTGTGQLSYYAVSVVGPATPSTRWPASWRCSRKRRPAQEGSGMSAVDVVLQVFRAVEERNPQLAVEAYHDDLEFHWPAPLPYAGSSYGLKASLERSPGWAQTWDPFQGETERQLSARVIAASQDEVVVLWHQRGGDPGRRPA
jgi:hypothetical protein